MLSEYIPVSRYQPVAILLFADDFIITIKIFSDLAYEDLNALDAHFIDAIPNHVVYFMIGNIAALFFVSGQIKSACAFAEAAKHPQFRQADHPGADP